MGGQPFLQNDLGSLSRGDIVEVTLTAGANVRLLDSSNLSRYKRGQNYPCYGGLAKVSPARVAVPSSGHWYRRGHTGLAKQHQSERSSLACGIFATNAANPRQRDQIASIAEHLAESAPVADDDHREFDVFISHASEDKDAIVRPLAGALERCGLSVWYATSSSSRSATASAERSTTESPIAASASWCFRTPSLGWVGPRPSSRPRHHGRKRRSGSSPALARNLEGRGP